MDWDHLRIVLAIRQAGSVAAAANALGMDRATVVRRLDALEARLGARIFDRRHDGCVLTTAGQQAIETIEAISGAVAGLELRLRGRDRRASGKVTLAVPDFFSVCVIAPALPSFQQAHPDLTLVLRTGYDLANLAQGEADIAVRNSPPEHQSLVSRRLPEGALAFFGSRSYLQERGYPEGSLAGHDLLLPPPHALALPLFSGALPYAGQGRCVLEGDVLSLRAAAQAGLGLALLPTSAVFGAPELLPCWPGRLARIPGYLITHRALARQARIRAVIDFLTDLLRRNAPAPAGMQAASLGDLASEGPQPSV